MSITLALVAFLCVSSVCGHATPERIAQVFDKHFDNILDEVRHSDEVSVELTGFLWTAGQMKGYCRMRDTTVDGFYESMKREGPIKLSFVKYNPDLTVIELIIKSTAVSFTTEADIEVAGQAPIFHFYVLYDEIKLATTITYDKKTHSLSVSTKQVHSMSEPSIRIDGEANLVKEAKTVIAKQAGEVITERLNILLPIYSRRFFSRKLESWPEMLEIFA